MNSLAYAVLIGNRERRYEAAFFWRIDSQIIVNRRRIKFTSLIKEASVIIRLCHISSMVTILCKTSNSIEIEMHFYLLWRIMFKPQQFIARLIKESGAVVVQSDITFLYSSTYYFLSFPFIAIYSSRENHTCGSSTLILSRRTERSPRKTYALFPLKKAANAIFSLIDVQDTKRNTWLVVIRWLWNGIIRHTKARGFDKIPATNKQTDKDKNRKSNSCTFGDGQFINVTLLNLFPSREILHRMF